MSHPMLPFESQDKNDDDGIVIDSFFVETDSPPDLKELNDPITVKLLPDPPVSTQILTGSQKVNPAWDRPTQILPADINRKDLQIWVYSGAASPVASDGVRVSDDIGTVGSAGRLLHTGNMNLDGHTGAVWVTTCGNGTNGVASDFVYVEWWSVTV